MQPKGVRNRRPLDTETTVASTRVLSLFFLEIFVAITIHFSYFIF